jgi:hypothetical protein
VNAPRTNARTHRSTPGAASYPVLVIDDHELFSTSLAIALRNEGFDAQTVQVASIPTFSPAASCGLSGWWCWTSCLAPPGSPFRRSWWAITSSSARPLVLALAQRGLRGYRCAITSTADILGATGGTALLGAEFGTNWKR